MFFGKILKVLSTSATPISIPAKGPDYAAIIAADSRRWKLREEERGKKEVVWVRVSAEAKDRILTLRREGFKSVRLYWYASSSGDYRKLDTEHRTGANAAKAIIEGLETETVGKQEAHGNGSGAFCYISFWRELRLK